MDARHARDLMRTGYRTNAPYLTLPLTLRTMGAKTQIQRGHVDEKMRTVQLTHHELGSARVQSVYHHLQGRQAGYTATSGHASQVVYNH